MNTSEENKAPENLDQNGIKLQNEKPKASSFSLFVWDLVKVFVISLLIIWPIRAFVAQPFIVSGTSMEPNFHNGEYLIVNELDYSMHQPQRGDIIVFKYPRDTKEYFIKRIIGLPGEEVRIGDGTVTIINKEHPQGFVLKEYYLPQNDLTFPGAAEDSDVKLGASEYFVMGDNRLASSDSRFWGPVPASDIVGKVSVRIFPFQNFSTFPTPKYSN